MIRKRLLQTLVVCVAVSQSALSSAPQIAYTYSEYLSPDSARLIAGVRANGSGFTAYFRCDFYHSGQYVSTIRTSRLDYAADSDIVEVSQTIGGIPSDTADSYTFWVVIPSGSDYVIGQGQWNSPHCHATSPKLVTLSPDPLDPGSATLRAICNTHGVPVSLQFAWGSEEAIIDGGTIQAGVINSSSDTIVSVPLNGLAPAMTFYVIVGGGDRNCPGIGGSGEYVMVKTPPDSNALSLTVPITIAPDSPYFFPSIVNIGVHTYATYCLDLGLGEDQLPPTAPGFDARLIDSRTGAGRCHGSGTYVDLRPYESPSQADTFKLRVLAEADYYPITLSWPSLENDYTGPTLLCTLGDTVDMKAMRSYRLTNPDAAFVTIIAVGPQAKPQMPLVLMSKAEIADSAGVRLRGLIHPNGTSTSAWFEWGSAGDSSKTASQEFVPRDSGMTPIESELRNLSPGKTYHYRIVAQNAYGRFDGADETFTFPPTTSVSGSHTTLPRASILLQNHPNPFNPSTTIAYEIVGQTYVRLQIFDALGQLIETLVSGVEEAGRHFVTWDALERPSGVYFYRIQAGKFTDVKKMILAR